MNPNHLFQIEAGIDRKLTADELAEVSSLADLSSVQLQSAFEIAHKSALLASLYLRGVAPSALYGEVRDLAFNLDAIFAKRFPRPRRLGGEQFFQAQLGRPLLEEEEAPAESLHALSSAHLAVALHLANIDADFANAYLGQIVRNASHKEREHLAEQLRHRAHL